MPPSLPPIDLVCHRLFLEWEAHFQVTVALTRATQQMSPQTVTFDAVTAKALWPTTPALQDTIRAQKGSPKSTQSRTLASICHLNTGEQTSTTYQKQISCETGMCEINARGTCRCSTCAPRPPYFNVEHQHGHESLQRQKRAFISLGKTTAGRAYKFNIEIGGSGGTIRYLIVA